MSAMTLDNSDVMYRLLVQGVVDYAIYMLSPEGTVANWNAGAERAKGYRQEEIVGRNFACFYSLEDQAAGVPQRGLEIARRTGRFEAQGWRFRKDGSSFWANVVIDAIYDEQGVFIGFAKVTRDITELRNREQQLLEAKELAERYSEQMASMSMFLDTVISNIPSSVVVQDAVTRQILLANRQAETLFDCPHADMIGKRSEECLTPQISEYFEQLADIALRTEVAHRSEEQLETPRGARTLRSRALSIHGHESGKRYLMLIADDITEENAANERIRFLAHHDILTGLPNRVQLRQRLNDALLLDNLKSCATATLCLDLDNFKNVNDALGHQYGDELLRQLAERLRKVLRSHDTLARLGGDEFAVILPGLSKPADAAEAAQRLIEAVKPEFLIDGHRVSVGISVGIALAPGDHTTPEKLLRYADMALYEAKRNGRNCHAFFRLDMDEAARNRRTIELELRDAIASEQLQLYYQPITDQDHTQVVGYEALMRWCHPVNGLVGPLDFIPIAEESGLIHEVGALALKEACREAASWSGQQTVAVNLSPMQFRNSQFVALVEHALKSSGLEPHRLELEITESVLLENSLGNIEALRQIKALGVRIALDDFGTGYSSLGYLRSFPFDRIKIDKTFTQDMERSREALAIVSAITGIGRSLDIQTTAEGVETRTQFKGLVEQGCSHFQGYLFGRPEPAERRLESISSLI